MALPKQDATPEAFANGLAYFSAKLAADEDPQVAALAPEVKALTAQVEEAELAMRRAGRTEMEARAVRDAADGRCDKAIKELRRELAGLTGPRHPILEIAFPDSVQYETAATGMEQSRRLKELLGRVDLALVAPQLARDPKAEKLTRVLQEGKAGLGEDLLKRLDAANAAWQSTHNALEEARLRLEDTKKQSLVQAGGVLGRLRGLVGSDGAAYSYT